MAAVEPLELNLSGVPEAEVPSRFDDLAHERRHEDLATMGLVGYAGRQQDRSPEQVVVVHYRLSRVHTDPDPQRLSRVRPAVGLEAPHDINRAQHGRAGAGERQHEAVTQRLDLDTSTALDVAAHEAVVHRQ